jgi:hypothetical protein
VSVGHAPGGMLPPWTEADESRYQHILDHIRTCDACTFIDANDDAATCPTFDALIDGWASVLSRWPHLAPAVVAPVRRVADGSAPVLDVCVCSRTDRLRGLGNSVVPAQAEAALRLLWWRAFGEWL